MNAGSAARRAGAVLAVVAAAAAVVGVTVFARARASTPLRCAPGMIERGPRCCGGGQTLDGAGRCTGAPTSCAAGLAGAPGGCLANEARVAIAGGELRLGPGDWEAQGVVAPRAVRVAPFWIDAHETTEAAWSACAASGRCPAVALRGEPGLPVVSVTLGEARAFCAARGGALPSADQLAFAAAGTAGRRYAWGDTGAVCRRAAWGLAHGPCGEGASGPEVAGSHPDDATPEGVRDLAGNVAEWTEPSDPAAPVAEARGGAWADAEAAALRTWRARALAPGARSPEVGFRCVHPGPAPLLDSAVP